MKDKNAFEASGNSPTISESGASILTGRGLEDVRERIRKAFEHVHGGQPAPEKQPQVYTETNAERFRERAKALTLRALSSPPIQSSRNGVWEISEPSKSAEELIADALRRDK